MSIYLTDEQIRDAANDAAPGVADRDWKSATGSHWRAIANAASDHARRVTLAEAYQWWHDRWEKTDGGMGMSSLEAFSDKFIASSSKAPTPAEAPAAPATESPLDEATVRRCIEALRDFQGRYVAAAFYDGANAMKEGIALLESLLPKPAPEPEQYVPLAEVLAFTLHGAATYTPLTLADIRKRHGLLTAEKAYDALRKHFGWDWDDDEVLPGSRDKAIAALRAAAKGGSK